MTYAVFPRRFLPQMTVLCALLQASPPGEGAFLTSLLVDRVSPGVDPAAKVKAEWLGAVAHGDVASPLVSREEAIRLLGTMLGGFNVPYLVRELEGPLAALAATALKHQFLDRAPASGRMPPFRPPHGTPVVIGQGGEAGREARREEG